MGFPGDILGRPGLRTQRHGRADGEATPPERPHFRWIPIRSLAERHRPRILAHLLTLGEADRYLRFGHQASDVQIGRYVDSIDFARDEVFGVFNRRLELVALAHLAYMGDSKSAEFGVSVLAKARGRGYGARLFDHAVLHARNRGIDTLVIHALSENTPMLRIARSAGATIERSGTESEAHLKLPADDMASHLSAAVEDGAAEIDYRLKAQARKLDGLLDAIAEVKDRMASKSGRAAVD
jgi:RimJ/RimL family protein N-acetyltransferase